MSLADVHVNDPHVNAHNDERHVINSLLDLTNTGRLSDTALTATYVVAVNPEFYGAGYGGALSDDWGPAFNAALVAATAAGVNVQCLSKSYGIRTTIVWPAGSRAHIEGRGETSRIYKLADVTLINCSGTSSQREYGRQLRYMFLDGGNNAAWTAPLYRNDYTSRADTVFCWFWQNYGSAMTSKQTWDCRHENVSILQCGGTDGLTPAVNLNGTIADGGNATNNVWFINPRIEAFRSGAIWAVGGDNGAAALFGIKIIGTAKFELSGGSSYYGPALRIGNVTHFTSDAIQFTLNGGVVAGTQTRPFEAFLHVYGVKSLQLGRIFGNVGSVLSGDVDALFHFDGATATNTEISWSDISLASGSGTTTNRPASVFKWSGTNNLVQRGSVRWNSNFWNIPTDSGEPTTLSSLPTVAGASDATYAAVAQRTAVNGDQAYDTNVSQVMIRIAGAWTTVGANVTRYPGTNPDWMMNGSIVTQPYRRNNIPRWAVGGTRTPTAGTMEMVALPLQVGDVVSNLFTSINTAYTFGTTGIGFWLALFGPQVASTMPLLAWTGDQSSSGGTIATGAYEKAIAKDAAGATITSYTVPATGIYWVGLLANVGTGGSPVNGKWAASGLSSFSLAQASITGEQSLARIADTGLTVTPPANGTPAGYPSQIIYVGSR